MTMTTTTTSLTPSQQAAYERDGYLFPLDIMSPQEARTARDELEALERNTPDGTLPLALDRYFRVNAHVVLPLAARIAGDPRILEAVSGVLGENLLVWGCEFFIKEPRTDKIVSWHQDLTYWGLGETDHEVTAWLALSDVSVASGCMRFVAGSHKQAIVPHTDTFHQDNLLSRGQELAVEVDEADAVNVELKPGQLSLHHGRIFHASGPNVSDDRRIGMAIRYLRPEVRQLVAAKDYAMLVRGIDRNDHWTHIAPPTRNFEPERIALHNEIMIAQSAALAEGAGDNVVMYTGMNS